MPSFTVDPIDCPAESARPQGPTGSTAAAVVLAVLVVVGQLYVVIPLLPDMTRHLAASSVAAGLLSSAFGLAYALGFVVLGPLTDRFGSRRVTLCGLAATAIATAAVAAAPPLTLVLTARVAQGFVASALTPAVLSYAVRRLRPEARVAVTTAIVGSALAAAIVAQLAAQLAAPALGWRGVFWMSTAAVVAVGVLLCVVLRPDDPHPVVSLPTAYRQIPHARRERRLVLLYLAAATLLAAFVALYTALELTRPGPRVAARLRVLVAMTAAATAAAAASFPFGLVWLGAALFVLTGAVAVAAPALVGEVTRRAPGQPGVASALYSAAVFSGASLGGLLGLTLAPVGFAYTALVGSAVLLAGTGAAAVALRGSSPQAAVHV